MSYLLLLLRRASRTVVVFAVITLVTTISATPATAHVPPPVWVSTEVSLDLPAIPNAIPAVGIATAGDSAVWTVDGEGAVTRPRRRGVVR